MSSISSPDHPPTPAVAVSANIGEHESTHKQEQNVASPISRKAELLKGLRLNDRLQERKNDFSGEDKRSAWKGENEAVKIYRDETVRRWKEEMDTLLNFAGIFTVVLTAFNVESYMLLSPTSPDPALAALTQISAQLTSFSLYNPFVNSTQPASKPLLVSSNSTSPERWAVWVNALWFSSLICSLSAASIVIMVKQWIQEYNSRISGTTLHTTRLRQHRYNGFVQWKVAEIIAILPVLLQIALGLFLSGLLVFLWNLNQTVAIIASTFIGALLIFTLVTTILPTFTSNCPYLSPFSKSAFRSFFFAYASIRPLVRNAVLSLLRMVPSESTIERLLWQLWRTSLRYSLKPSVYAMQLAYVTAFPDKLDQDIFFTAYSTTGDMSLLDHASTCFSDHSIGDLSEFLTRIHAQNRQYGQPDGASEHWTSFIPLDMASDMLLVQLCGPWSETREIAYSTNGYLVSSDVVRGKHRISCVLSNMAAVLYNNGNRHDEDFPMQECLAALSKQMETVKETKSALKAERRRVIAAIYTVLRTSMLYGSWGDKRQLCLSILISWSSLSISRSQPGDMAEEDTEIEALADAIALAEEALFETLHSPGFQDGGSESKCLTVDFFFDYYQHIDLAQLASRVSDRVPQTLKHAVEHLPLGERNAWTPRVFDGTWKNGLLEWLQSLEEERLNNQKSMRAAESAREQVHRRERPEEASSMLPDPVMFVLAYL